MRLGIGYSSCTQLATVLRKVQWREESVTDSQLEQLLRHEKGTENREPASLTRSLHFTSLFAVSAVITSVFAFRFRRRHFLRSTCALFARLLMTRSSLGFACRRRRRWRRRCLLLLVRAYVLSAFDSVQCDWRDIESRKRERKKQMKEIKQKLS